MKIDRTKYLILDSLIELMQNKFLKDIYVKDIAKKAHITRQTFYRHFKDKYDVVIWYYDVEVESLFISTDSLDGIHDNLVAKLEKYKENLTFVKNAYHCNSQNALITHEFQRIYNSLSLKIYENSRIHIDDHALEVKYALEFFCHGIIHMTIDWLNASCPISTKHFADLIIDFIPTEVKTHLKKTH